MSDFQVIDQQQLERIEHTHRGYLYQHLYVAGCLLIAPAAGVTAVAPERNEDVELQFPDKHIYAQIKHYSDPLQPSDVNDVLERYKALRELHQRGERTGGHEFYIISSSVPSPSLARNIAGQAWPSDVQVIYPGCENADQPYMPPAWRTLEEAAQWCTERAGELPFCKLSPTTLVWKLAALVMLAL